MHLPRPQLRVAVVDAALAVHRDVKLPAWLVCMFEVGEGGVGEGIVGDGSRGRVGGGMLWVCYLVSCVYVLI